MFFQINCFFLLWLLRVLCIKAAATMISNNRNNSSSNHHHHQNQHPPLPNQQQGPSSAMVTASPSGQQSNHQHHHHHRNQHLNGHGTGSVSGRNHYHQQSVFSRQSILVSLRAAVLLLPLYGLHYLVIVYRPKIENCWLSETYHYLSLSLDGLQGLAISIIFCFANSEVSHSSSSYTVIATSGYSSTEYHYLHDRSGTDKSRLVMMVLDNR
ncbi:hypothetical protein TYRP_001357 [Tyrophagus putrescentiae]|nr:hypothetical protein TYRP_001357 [Tyrophagus putrescentiae]